jgi:predicted HicB family RNase H-like nuclease
MARNEMASDCMQYNGYSGSVEVSIEDGCLHGRILFIDDLITYEGDSVPELKSNFHGAVDRYVADCVDTGRPANKPYSGTFNVRIGPDLHRQAAQAAYKAGIKLNEFVLRSVQQAVEMSGCIQINHHHEHDVRVTLHNPDEAVALELSASGAKPPEDWQSIIQTRH